MTSAILLGLTIGLRHALDPDHLAAVSTLVARERRAGRVSLVGAVWGLGHGAMVLSIGALAVVLGVGVPARFSLAAEVGVALLLVALGASNLHHARQPHAHAHPRPRSRAPESPPGAPRSGGGALWRSAFIGVAHGLAGTGLVAVMAVAAFPERSAALFYLAAFALATLAGMVVASLVLSAPLFWLRDSHRAHRVLHAVTGAASVAVGLLLLVEGLPALWRAA